MRSVRRNAGFTYFLPWLAMLFSNSIPFQKKKDNFYSSNSKLAQLCRKRNRTADSREVNSTGTGFACVPVGFITDQELKPCRVCPLTFQVNRPSICQASRIEQWTLLKFAPRKVSHNSLLDAKITATRESKTCKPWNIPERSIQIQCRAYHLARTAKRQSCLKSTDKPTAVIFTVWLVISQK